MVTSDRVLVKYLERSQSKHAKAKAKREKGLRGEQGPRRKRRTRRKSKTK